MKTLVLNDIHVGFNRVGGTTPGSREELRAYLLGKLDAVLADHFGPVLIVGDLFDDFEVGYRDWVDTYLLISLWLSRSPLNELILVAGNHDHSPRGDKVSSFEALVTALQTFDSAFQPLLINDYKRVAPNAWAVAHHANQDLFDASLLELLEQVKAGELVFLHANYHNNFALESDHSLNVSEDMALKFCNKGVKLIFAHEHQQKATIPHGMKADAGGEVIIMGNQWPTSISDCLGNAFKRCHYFDSTGFIFGEHTWDADHCEEGFLKIDWRELDTAGDQAFIRVVGEATMNQASDVVQAVAKFRQKSDAFIVNNAVKVAGMAEIDDLPATFEAAKAFDVMGFIKGHLTEDEFKVVEGLL